MPYYENDLLCSDNSLIELDSKGEISTYKRYQLEEIIIKHSPNIIDLIDVGDFVNGFPVLEPVYNGNVMYGVDEGYENFKKAYGEIKSIVTKEQFKAMEYRLEK